MSDQGGAEIIAFYSYKGGTGRSMLLANVAWILASNSKRVLMVDWDLEAPGLHRYFRPFLLDKDLVATDGLIDLVWSFTDAAMTPVEEDERTHGWHEAYADVLPYTAAVRWSFPLPGRLDLLSAGKQGPSYSRSVNSFNWQNFYDRLGGGVFLESVKAQMRKEYDYVLIDSRTGVSDTAGICTVQMPDALVMCFTANNQSIQGCASIAQSVRKQWTADGRSPGRQRILPVLTRIDSSEKDKLNTRRELARTTFDPYVATIAPNAIDEYWRDIEIPYVPWYSYEEMLAAFADKYREKISVLDSAEALTRMLTDGAITSVLRPGDDDRLRVLKQFAVADGTPPESIVTRAPDAEVVCPYPGLQPFTAKDAAMFFGRESEVDEILGRLRAGEREIYVVGPSGSGKSSLIAAGLRPRLEHGVPGLGTFLIRSMRPGDHPATRLGETIEGDITASAVAINALLARQKPSASMLLVIDQLEELFTLANYDERSTFVAALRTLRSHPRCVLLFVLRADFVGTFMQSPLGFDLDGRFSRIYVSPLRDAALRAVIERPAHELGVSFEPDLIERLLGDTRSDPRALPWLQETLMLLWTRRKPPLLTLAGYEALSEGGQSGFDVTIARRSDATLRALTAAQQTIARRILVRLVRFGEKHPNTRQQQTVHALMSATDDSSEFSYVLQHLVNHRLVTVDGTDGNTAVFANLSHDALIMAWPAFREWIVPRQADEQQRRRLEAKVDVWIEQGWDTEGLLDSVELSAATHWMQSEAAQELGYGAGLPALIVASQFEIGKRERRELRRQLRRKRRRIAAISMFIMSSVVASILGFVTLREQHQAHRRLGMAYLEKGRDLLVDGHPTKAVPYFVAARAEEIGSPVIQMLFAQASKSLPLVTFVGHRSSVRNAAFSPDGTRVVTASDDGTARIWNVSTEKPVTLPLQHQGPVTAVAFSPDGKRVVTASNDNTARLWDASSGKRVAPPLEHQGIVYDVTFSPDGTRVVTAISDNTARIWDVRTGQPVTAPLLHEGPVVAATFSADGMKVVTASRDMTARVWNATTGQPVTEPLRHRDQINAATFSPDGTKVVTASRDKTACVWDLKLQLVTAELQHENAVVAAAFSPDGTRVVTASEDKTARVWDATTGLPVTAPLEHQGEVMSVAFSAGGTQVVTASRDKTARVWDARLGQPATAPFEYPGEIRSLAYSSDGTRVVTASRDKTVRVWNAKTGQPVSPLFEHQGMVTAAAFSPDGLRIVTASEDNTARIWDAKTGKLMLPPLEHQGMVRAVVFSLDGLQVVTASDDKTARVWDATTGKLVTTLNHQGVVVAAAFSPDGTRVVTASYDSKAQVWDAKTGTPVTPPLEHVDIVTTATFSPDGTRVVTASYDGTARIWNASTGKPVTAPLKHKGWVHTAVFSPDGTCVVTASADHTARMWNATTGTPLFSALDHQGHVLSAAFSADGSRIVTASDDTTARVWDATTGKPCSPPLKHQYPLRQAIFNPNGTRVVTMGDGKAARVWEFPLDDGTLVQWSTIAEKSPYTLVDGNLSLRPSRLAETGDD